MMQSIFLQKPPKMQYSVGKKWLNELLMIRAGLAYTTRQLLGFVVLSYFGHTIRDGKCVIHGKVHGK